MFRKISLPPPPHPHPTPPHPPPTPQVKELLLRRPAMIGRVDDNYGDPTPPEGSDAPDGA